MKKFKYNIVSAISFVLFILSLVAIAFDYYYAPNEMYLKIIMTVFSLIALIISAVSFLLNKQLMDMEKIIIERSDLLLSAIDDESQRISRDYLEQIEYAMKDTLSFASKSTPNDVYIVTTVFSNVGEDYLTMLCNNIMSNVSYHYIVSKKDENELLNVISKIREIITKKHNGKSKLKTGTLSYYVDDVVIDSLPNYSDIILYTTRMSSHIDPNKLKGFYCFQESDMNGKYFYMKMNNDMESRLLKHFENIQSKMKIESFEEIT